MDATKLLRVPKIRSDCQFLFNKPLDSLPQIDHRLFAVLALIDSGYTESQLISALEGRISQTDISALLDEIKAQRYVSVEQTKAGQVLYMEFLGKRFLDSYLLVMKRGVQK